MSKKQLFVAMKSTLSTNLLLVNMKSFSNLSACPTELRELLHNFAGTVWYLG
jgi:hypothetical protein